MIALVLILVFAVLAVRLFEIHQRLNWAERVSTDIIELARRHEHY